MDTGKRILIVDDDGDVRETLQRLLESAGHRVFVANSGAEALELAAAELPDLVLLDVVMPGMGGFDVLKALRANPQLEQTLVVMLTARADPESMERSWQGGSDLYLTKPFAPPELLSFLDTILT